MVDDEAQQRSLNSSLNFDIDDDDSSVSVDVVTVNDDDEPLSLVEPAKQATIAKPVAVHASQSMMLQTTSSCSETLKTKISCRSCGMLFRFPSKLRRHEKIHQPESQFPKEFPCDQCPKAFRYAYHLRRHKWLIHAPERPVFTCDICLKSYKGEELFRLHRAMAHQPTSFQSVSIPERKPEPVKIENVPSSSTSTNSQKKKQLQQQSSAFVCHICSISFKQKHYLTQHLMTHSIERPFICEICHKGFARASTLFAHRFVHTVGRHFKCGTCHKAFKHKRSLTEHIKSKICNAPGAANDDRAQAHRASTCSSTSTAVGSGSGESATVNAAEQNQYVCDVCGAFFASVSYLYLHRRRCHRGTQQPASFNAPPNPLLDLVSTLQQVADSEQQRVLLPVYPGIFAGLFSQSPKN